MSRVRAMKLSRNRLRLSSGKVLKFRSRTARKSFECVAQAIKHGWKPRGSRGRKGR